MTEHPRRPVGSARMRSSARALRQDPVTFHRLNVEQIGHVAFERSSLVRRIPQEIRFRDAKRSGDPP